MTSPIVALVGNPNSGKSTLYNALIKGKQRIGNWAGVTVELARGQISDGDFSIEVVDLPGCYCCDPMLEGTVDERITGEYLLKQEAALIINVVDATHLTRHLYLTLQLLERGFPVILALNMMDEAKQQNVQLDVELLARHLGCPVVPISAAKNQGIAILKETIKRVLEENRHAFQTYCSPSTQATAYYERIYKIVEEVVKVSTPQQISWTEKMDRVLLNRFMGIPFFFGLMYLLFFLAIRVGVGIQEQFEVISRMLFLDGINDILKTVAAPPWLVTFVANGVGQGLYITVSFIPVMAGMFLGLSFLEASGYMARAAFVMDKIMQSVGLPGKSFVPLMIGFGCNVPAVMAARTLQNDRERLLTILMSPFMSCSARFSIYALFAAAFFPTRGEDLIFILYVIGIFVAFVTGLILRTTLLSEDRTPLIMELPPYRWPSFRMLVHLTWQRLKSFLLKAGVLIIFLCSIIGLFSFKTNNGETAITHIGKAVTPIFRPMGIKEDNWQATVGLLTGVIAKETVVGTLKALYLQEENKVDLVTHFGGTAAAIAYLLFILLYFPCISVVATMSRELNKSWALFSVIWTTGVAYSIAVFFYQVTEFTTDPLRASAWVIGIITTLSTGLYLMRCWAKRKILKGKRGRPIPTKISLLSLNE
jgi:ferrous iron transport protein B